MSDAPRRRELMDRSGIFALAMFAHVKISNTRHHQYGRTGTIVRINPEKRMVWVAMHGGTVTRAGCRSVSVIL